MSTKQPQYLSYLLRLWRVSEEEKPLWRVSLQRPDTGKRLGFASPDELFEFLRRQMGVMSVVDGDDSER
jgi:hypothetical protein